MTGDVCQRKLCVSELHPHLRLARWSEVPGEGKEVTTFILSVCKDQVRCSHAVIYGKADDIK